MDKDADDTLRFALNAVKESDDIFFHLQGSILSQWTGIGIGRNLQDTLMFVIYRAGVATDLTISPRFFSKSGDSYYRNDIDYELIDGPGDDIFMDNMFNVNIHCKNCSTWANKDGSMSLLNMTSLSAPFMYAFGPNNRTFHSTSQDAHIERPVLFGQFSLDMTKATTMQGPGSIPPASALIDNTGSSIGKNSNQMYQVAFHGVSLALIFGLFLPGGVIFASVYNRMLQHRVMQFGASVFAVIAIAIGIAISTQIPHARSFSSAHQILGFVVAAALICQCLLGLIQYMIRKITMESMDLFLAHRILGPLILVSGLVNVFLGLQFGDQRNISWPLAIYVMAALFCLLIATVERLRHFKNKFTRLQRATTLSSQTPEQQSCQPARALAVQPTQSGQQDIGVARHVGFDGATLNDGVSHEEYEMHSLAPLEPRMAV